MYLLKEKTQLKVAIVPSKGIGDAIIFLQAVKSFEETGHRVSIYHDSIKTLNLKMPKSQFFSRENLMKDYLNYDVILTQFDDSQETKTIITLRDSHPAFYLFYPTHKKDKHGPLHQNDYASNPELSMVENLKFALNKFFSLNTCHHNILSLVPKKFRMHSRRVVIHPFSTEKSRVWPLKKYIKVAHFLKKKGYDPYFIMSEEEKNQFTYEEKTLSFETLSQLSDFIHESGFFIGNESGPSHLASLVNIPSIIIAQDHKRMKLWKPGFSPVTILTPSKWILNFKGLRIRQLYWKNFISVKQVKQKFLQLS